MFLKYKEVRYINYVNFKVLELLIAIGVISSHIIFVPMGIAKAFPVQHAINLIAATLLGPSYAVSVAFVISILRNILGVGSLLAFPGSMIGAFLAGILFQKTKKVFYALLGELLGTGILGGIIAYPVAKLFMGKEATLFFMIGPFLISSMVGAFIGFVIYKGIKNLNI